MMSRNPSYYYSGEADLERALGLGLGVPPVQRQDSLYRDASRAGGGSQHSQEGWARTLRLAFQCFGVLYGDIGTSPLYVYSTTFNEGGIRHTDDLLGVLSLIVYSFLLFTIIKYVYIALRANDDGDGGTFALYSLISRHAKVSLVPNQQAEDELHMSKSSSLRRPSVQNLASTAEQRAQWVKDLLETSRPVRISLFVLTILATAMVISDACLTPAISVLSAVGGLKDKAPHLNTEQVVWVTVGILVALFAVQRFGTDKVGYLFAPVVLLWLLLIGGVGVYNLAAHDVGVLRAFNPKYILDYFRRNGRHGWVSLGGVLLCFTGTEALFADLGCFSIRSIQLSFAFGLVPAVLLAYAGQAAYLRRYPEQVGDAFYASTPQVLFWPTFVLALAASVVGSQAMISCAFATISHSQAMGCFPRVKIVHTSRQYQGQVYIPEINFLLGAAACVSVYLTAVLYKFVHGGYIPVAMSAVLMAVMGVWHYVHVRRYKYELERTVSAERVRELMAARELQRVPGVGLFYTDLVQGIPPVFPHLIEKIPSIHTVLLFVSVKHLPVPHVDPSERFLFRQVEPQEHKLFRCVARYGYRDRLEDARDFVASLVDRLQYYVRDVNLYGCAAGGAAKVSYPSSRCDSMGMGRGMGMAKSASYAERLQLQRARSVAMQHSHSHSQSQQPPQLGQLLQYSASTGGAGQMGERRSVYAEEMLTPAESFSEMGTMASGRQLMAVAVKMSLEEMARIEEEQRFIQREMEKGVVFILGESEVVARPHSSLLKRLVVNYAYSFLRRNCRQGDKMLAIPRSQLLKVGMSYEI
ncbi:hypothetical protein E2562_004613 [Oryza meyeriana var. granulata]|uniref:Potassium transporter n=1 Tax=Oryza meyeriana var. granulata TaxID=110450 RepID=A0A6G1F3V2_9ORYZ|nr:hypothetical protein E2562_004613 [Oryza meyeriana var. granulata]